MRIELCNCQQILLDEIADKSFKRKDVSKTYALALRSSEDVDWKFVNKAIIKRWSYNALNYILELAWSGKCFEEKGGE